VELKKPLNIDKKKVKIYHVTYFDLEDYKLTHNWEIFTADFST